MQTIVDALKTLRIGKIFDEYMLQEQIALAFRQANICYQKEYLLAKGNRLDFFMENGIAVEIKKSKPNRTKLVEQINRYAAFEEVKGVVIVVETSLKYPIEHTSNGKPCAVIGLQKLWGIAL